MNDAKIPGIPATEKICVQLRAKSGNQYVITSKEYLGEYYIYNVKNDGAVRLGKGNNPLELEEEYAK